MSQSGTEFERQELMKKTVEELRKICKENGISYYENGKRLTKGLMVEKLIDNKQHEQPVIEVKPFVISDEAVKEIEMLEKLEIRKKYIEQAKVGMIVAFRLPSGKVISAAITKKSTKGRKYMVETKYGAEYKISFDDVIWVRTNKRWPKGVYLMFKRNTKAGVNTDGKENN